MSDFEEFIANTNIVDYISGNTELCKPFYKMMYQHSIYKGYQNEAKSMYKSGVRPVILKANKRGTNPDLLIRGSVCISQGKCVNLLFDTIKNKQSYPIYITHRLIKIIGCRIKAGSKMLKVSNEKVFRLDQLHMYSSRDIYRLPEVIRTCKEEYYSNIWENDVDNTDNHFENDLDENDLMMAGLDPSDMFLDNSWDF